MHDGCTQYPIHIGPVEGVSVASLPVCLQRLKMSIRDLHSVLEGRLCWWVLISGLVVVSMFFAQPCTTSTPPRLHLSTSSPVHLRNSTRPTNALSQFFQDSPSLHYRYVEEGLLTIGGPSGEAWVNARFSIVGERSKHFNISHILERI